MIGKDRKQHAALDRLADALVEDIFKASDEEILAEFREFDGDPEHNAAQMRALFEKSVLATNKRRLAEAKSGAARARRLVSLALAPSIDMEVARARLRAIINTPNLPQSLTLAARKENELSDADVLGILEDLRELGVLAPDHSQDKEC